MQASGRDGVWQFMAPLFATMFRESEQQILRSQARFLTSRLAAMDVWWTMDGAPDARRPAAPDALWLFNLVMRKEREGWRILIWHNMELGGPPPEGLRAWRFVIFDSGGPVEGASSAL
jgi:uncharacterized protein (TIGR02246 family)